MGKSQVNLQDIFLNQMRKEKIPVTMYLVNGARLTGTIKGFDNFVILMKQENQQLVYKHAISTIIPEKPVELLDTMETKKEQNRVQGSRMRDANAESVHSESAGYESASSPQSVQLIRNIRMAKRSARTEQVSIGVIGGSGLYEMEGLTQIRP